MSSEYARFFVDYVCPLYDVNLDYEMGDTLWEGYLTSDRVELFVGIKPLCSTSKSAVRKLIVVGETSLAVL